MEARVLGARTPGRPEGTDVDLPYSNTAAGPQAMCPKDIIIGVQGTELRNVFLKEHFVMPKY